MTRRRRAGILGGVLLSLTACSSDVTPGISRSDVPTGGSGPGVVRAWRSFPGCEELVTWVRGQMEPRVTAWGLGGDGFGPRPVMARSGHGDPGMPVVDDLASTVLEEFDTTRSTTTVQEEGIDEGDLVETDGRHLYGVVEGILRAVDLESMALVGEHVLPGGEHQMILTTTALVVVTLRWDTATPSTRVARFSLVDEGFEFQGATHLEGSTVAMRGQGSRIRIVLRHDPVARLGFVMPRGGDPEGERIALAENRAVIAAVTAQDLLPRAFEEAADGTRTSPSIVLPCDRVGTPGEFSGFGLSWVATLDTAEPVDDLEVVASGGVVADASSVYATAGSLYVATTRAQDLVGPTVSIHASPVMTDIHRFDLGTGPVARYRGSGTVPGWLVNSYAMSEHAGRLRVATTSDSAGFGGERDSGVHVLELVSGSGGEFELVEVGAVRGLGPGETIQAVRYLGASAYVVTFRQVDPLYVIDLRDPREPRVEGELKVPGYSTHLHPVGAGRLVGVGFDATSEGRVTGTQLSLFDVAVPTVPSLLATVAVGDWTEAAVDPHAVLWWPETRDLVVPAPEGALVARVHDDVIVTRGRLQASEPARRSVIAGGRLVTVHPEGVRIWDLATLAGAGQVLWR